MTGAITETKAERLLLEGRRLKVLCAERQVSAEHAHGVVVDWLRFTFLEARAVHMRTGKYLGLAADEFARAVAGEVAELLGFEVGETRKGRDFYQHTVLITNADGVEMGYASAGNERQLGTVGAEIAAVVKSKIAARGFAANDPRFGGTVSAVGSAVIQIATAVVVGGTAPAWGSVLATAAIAGAVGYGIQALANWFFNPDGTVTYKPPEPTFVPAPNQKWIWYEAIGKGYPLTDNGSGSYSSDEFCQARFKGDPQWVFSSSSASACWMKYSGPPWGDPSAPPTRWAMNNIGWITSTPDPNYKPPGAGAGPITKPAAEALQALSDVDKAKPLPAKVIADMADAAFRAAASQPGYGGVPYSMSDPITEADVAAFRAANPTFQPATIGDLAAGISPSDPLGQASTAPSTGSPVNPAASSPLLNLGADPGIGSPSLEATPTGTQILQPLKQLMPDLRTFQVPAHQAICPRPSFDLFGKVVVMDGQCTVLEGVRGELYNAMVLAFLLIALFIVLSA